MRKVFVGAAAVLAFGAIAACSAGTPNGTIEGTLTMVGGPAPGTAQPVGGQVTVYSVSPDQAGTDAPNTVAPIASAPVGEDGQFSITIPPGRYTLTGTSPNFGDGTYECAALDAVAVTAGASTTAEVVCPMR